jgi:hypothetical protein
MSVQISVSGSASAISVPAGSNANFTVSVTGGTPGGPSVLYVTSAPNFLTQGVQYVPSWCGGDPCGATFDANGSASIPIDGMFEQGYQVWYIFVTDETTGSSSNFLRVNTPGNGGGGGVIQGPGIPGSNAANGALLDWTEAQPVPVPTLPSPLTSLGTLPQPTGLAQVLASRFGYIPQSDLSSVNKAVTLLQAAVATATGRSQTLTGDLSTANQALAAAQAVLQSIIGQIATLRGTVIPNLESEIAGFVASVGTESSALQDLQTTLGGWKSQRAALVADIGVLTGEIQALAGSFTEPIAAPTSVLSGDAAEADDGFSGSQDAQGGPNDPGSGPYDTGFSGFAPATLGFSPGYGGLGAFGSGAVGANGPQTAFSGLGILSSGSGSGGPVATLLGYVPASSAAFPLGSISALLKSLGTANGSILSQGALLAGVRAQVAGLNAPDGPIAAQTAILTPLSTYAVGLQNQWSGLESGSVTPASIQSAIDAVTSQIASVKQDVENLGTQRDGLLSGLQTLQAGSFPVSFSWNFGDGGTSGGGTSGSALPSHTYETPGSFAPSLTVTIIVPATAVTSGQPYTKTFSLGSRLIGQWPRSMTVGSNNNFIVWDGQDGGGNPVYNVRVLVRYKSDVSPFGVKGHQVYTTNIAGDTGNVASSGAGKADGVCLRNPHVQQEIDLTLG